MGLLDFFRRRRERESALAEAQAVSPGTFQIEPSSRVEGPDAGQVKASRAGQTLDLRDVEGLREEVLDVLRQHGIDPDSAQSVDTASVPGLEEAVLRAFQNHGLDFDAITRDAIQDRRGPA